MNWAVILVLVLLVGYVISETVGSSLKEGFAVPRRSDIGPGMEEGGAYRRDLRYTEAFVDIQGLGVASDFCRAVRRVNDPDSLRISCALGRRDGMDTMEYNSLTKGEGFRFSRDDYWRPTSDARKRMDYCRILKDEVTDEWFSGCAIAGPSGFKAQEERDSEPPPAIQSLLEAYEGILTWFRWQDDRDDYAGNAAFSVHGKPNFPTMLKPEVSRGLQLNRWPAASQAAGEPAPPLRDYLRWGEKGTMELHQVIQPRQIRAIAAWVWWDAFEEHATIFESRNHSTSVHKKDRICLGVEGGGPVLAPAERDASPAVEARPDVVQAIGQLTEPAYGVKPHEGLHKPKTARYYFEIWDHEQRIMRLDAPMSSAIRGQWQHVAVTVTGAADWWPTWQIWLDGKLVGEKSDGRMSPAMELSENYIGRNMRGCIQDFRVYRTPLVPSKLKEAIAWSKPKLHPLP